jgi:hypothetical protein
MRIARSSVHPVKYSIVLVVRREGCWHTVRTFDNSHAVEEHHEHRYRGNEKRPPIVTYGPVNVAMSAADKKLRQSWEAIVRSWEKSR